MTHILKLIFDSYKSILINLSEEEKEKKRQYRWDRNKNLAEEEK